MDFISVLTAMAALLTAGAQVTAAISQLVALAIQQAQAGTAPGESAAAERAKLDALAAAIAATEAETRAKAALIKALVKEA